MELKLESLPVPAQHGAFRAVLGLLVQPMGWHVTASYRAVLAGRPLIWAVPSMGLCHAVPGGPNDHLY